MATEALMIPGLLDGTTPIISAPPVLNSHYQIEKDCGQLIGSWTESTVLELIKTTSPGQLEIFSGIDQIQPLPNATIQIFPKAT